MTSSLSDFQGGYNFLHSSPYLTAAAITCAQGFRNFKPQLLCLYPGILEEMPVHRSFLPWHILLELFWRYSCYNSKNGQQKGKTKAYHVKNKLKKEDFKGAHIYFVSNNYITNILWTGVHLCNISLLMYYQHTTASKLVKKPFYFIKRNCVSLFFFQWLWFFHRYGYKLIDIKSSNCGSFAGSFLLDGKPELFACVLMLT